MALQNWQSLARFAVFIIQDRLADRFSILPGRVQHFLTRNWKKGDGNGQKVYEHRCLVQIRNNTVSDTLRLTNWRGPPSTISHKNYLSLTRSQNFQSQTPLSKLNTTQHIQT